MKILKCRGIEDLLHWTLVSIAFYFSFVFYKDMLFGLLLAGLVFELMKPSLFQTGFAHRRETKGVIFIILGSIFIFLSLLATCSALTNNYQKLVSSGTKQIETQEYESQKLLENNTKQELEKLQQQLENYPSIDSFDNESDWREGRQDIQNKIDVLNDELNEIVQGYNSINQYEEIATDNQYKSYTKLFELISMKIDVKADYIAILVFILIAVLIEIGIVVTKNLAVLARQKRLGNYKPTFEERMKNYQEQLMEHTLNNLFSNVLNTDHFKNNLNDNQEEKEVKKITTATEGKILENINLSEEKEEENTTQNLFQTKTISIDNIRKYLNYLLENSTDDVVIGYKKVAEGLNLKQGEAQRIFDRLKDKNYLTTENRKTKINKKDFNESDFIS